MDVGGTFTDLVLDDDGSLRVAKVPSTRHDQAEGVLDGVERLEADATTLGRFAHGTTVATNALLERDGARTVLVTTAGFRDLLEIGRQDRPSLYDLTVDRPPPLVARDQVVEADERLAADGSVLRALEEPDAVAAAVAALEPEAVAICLLFSFRDDRHERAVADAVAQRLGGVPVSRSSEVLAVFREYERASTTALNAYVAPRLARYLASLQRRLEEAGLRCTVEVMRSGGGTFAAELAARLPVHTLLSGPAAGAWGAAAVARASGRPDVIAFDMGGTSTDVTLVDGGRPATTAEGAIGGLPFAATATDIHTVGAGGGSIAWRDAGGALRVGPRSAGAEPGPAAYGRGGTDATVTDAHVVLGRLDPNAPLGGTLQLEPDAAAAAVGRLGERLGLDVEECALGIVRVAEANITRALRVVSVERGKDPRDRALLAFGGAGPLHQGPLARELGCPVVIVPPHAGVLAALGLLAAPIATDSARTHLRLLDRLDTDQLEDGWRQLEAEARELLDEQAVTARAVHRSADCRYRGQAYELEVPVDDADADALAAAFHALHDERYGYAQPDEPVEVVNLRVRAEGPPPRSPLPEVADGRGAEQAEVGTRRVVVDGQGRECPVYARERLGRGDRFRGPAVVAGVDTTCLVLADQTASVDQVGSLVLTFQDG
ncbi:MAG TPA: hydantoinase/oxoprolinase family protein [Nitriliruptorales bacterium]|nr:hydantoinase/oxoprolinase family protein [Nitriliruptorales bacterium]